MPSVKIDVKISPSLLEGLPEELISDEATMLEIHNLFAKMCDPYVPFLEGPLSQTVEVRSDGNTYIQPYARYQYYGTEFKHTLDYHPLASAKWDEAMMTDKGEEFLEQVKQILIRRANELYG